MINLSEGRGKSRVKEKADEILNDLKGKGGDANRKMMQDIIDLRKRRLDYQEKQSKWKRKEAKRARKEREARERQSELTKLPFQTGQVPSGASSVEASHTAAKDVANVASVLGKVGIDALRDRKKKEGKVVPVNVREVGPKRLTGSPPPPPKRALGGSKPPLPGRGFTPNPPQTGFRRGMTAGQRARRNPRLKQQLIQQRSQGMNETYEYEYSCWMEEFLYELGEKRRKNEDRDTPVDILKGENTIKINPSITEENVPTRPELWAKAKQWAKSRYDVYPSAYANGAASKWYKQRGGSWKSKGK
jgi:hypothetical protein